MELLKLDFEAKPENVIITDESVSFNVGEKNVKIHSHHEQDCCEHVYADFSAIQYAQKQLNDIGGKFTLTIKGVKDMGFIMMFDEESDCYNTILNRLLVPCYNSQNGYYSTDLQLIVDDGVRREIDITGCVEDDIQ